MGLFLLIGISGLAQNKGSENKIFGQIIDENGLDSIPLCIVEVFDDNKNRITFSKSGFDGEFQVSYCSNLTTSSSIELKLTAVGYYSRTFNLDVQKHTWETFELKLDPMGRITPDSLNNMIPYITCGGSYSVILTDESKYDLYKHYCTGHIKTLEEIINDKENYRDWNLLNLDSLSICDKATIRAIFDSQAKQYFSIGYGLMMLNPKEWDYYDFKNKYAQYKYNISISNGGCVITEDNSCYSGKMQEIIYREFGDTIFTSINRETKIEYEKHIQRLIDSNHIFNWELTDEAPFFIDGDNDLKRFFQKNIAYQIDSSGIVHTSFVVNIDGSLTDFKIVKSLSKNTDIEAIRLLKLMPNWSPGILNKQKVRTKVFLPIKFTG